MWTIFFFFQTNNELFINDLVHFIAPMKWLFFKHEYYQNKLLGLDPYQNTIFNRFYGQLHNWVNYGSLRLNKQSSISCKCGNINEIRYNDLGNQCNKIAS